MSESFWKKEEVKTPVSPFTSPKEKILSEGEFSERRNLGGGINITEFVEIKDDGSGVLKETTEDYAKRERAAYLIDRFLGFNFVPPTVLKEEGDAYGLRKVLQEFVKNAETAYIYEDEYKVQKEGKPPILKSELLKLHLFDAIIGSWDRDGNNYLVSEEKIFAIDNERSLNEDEDRHTGYSRAYLGKVVELIAKGEKIPQDIVASLKNFESSKENQILLSILLEELLKHDAVSWFMKRLLILVDAIKEDGGLDGQKMLEL